jgi:hypothetical protein
MELRDALAQISEIRQQVARTEVFRGYRAVPVAFSGVVALAVAGIQQVWLPDPRQNIVGYLSLWVAAALASLLATGAEMLVHCWRAGSSLTREMAWLAVSQFLPCVAVGGLLMFVLAGSSPENVWMLPGLWQLLFSLGIFASYRLLPRPTFYVAVFYLCAGTMCLTLGEAALSPWAMGIPFGLGQLFAAAILYWTLERDDDHEYQQVAR